MTTGQTSFLTLHFQKHSDFVGVSFAVQRMFVFQRIGTKTSSAQFICADVPFVTTPGTSGFSFVQNDLSQVKTVKLLDIKGYLPPLFVELKENERLKGERTQLHTLFS